MDQKFVYRVWLILFYLLFRKKDRLFRNMTLQFSTHDAWLTLITWHKLFAGK